MLFSQSPSFAGKVDTVVKICCVFLEKFGLSFFVFSSYCCLEVEMR